MSFFKKNPEESRRAKMDIFEMCHIKNELRTQPCFLVGSGPSLFNSNLKALEGSGFPIIGLNNSFTKITPDIWIGVDNVSGFDPTLFSSSFMKLTQWPLRYSEYKKKKLCDLDNFYFFHVAADRGGAFAGDNITFLFEGNTFSTALHILMWMGFETVCLVGCDFGGGKALRYKGRGTRMYKTPKAAYLDEALDFLKFASEKNKTKYISCSPASKANDFLPFLKIEDVLEKYSFSALSKFSKVNF